jgi:phytanoyl-CoA hydroxylase
MTTSTLYERDGFVVREGVLSADVVSSLRQRAREIVLERWRDSWLTFSTVESDTRGPEFVRTGSEIALFWEAEARRSRAKVERRPETYVNKIGHALHDLDLIFGEASRCDAFASLSADCGIERPFLVQSQYIFKNALHGGEVAPHNDHTYLWSDPPATHALWLAIDDAHVDNGCLRVIPGGQRLRQRARYRRSGGWTALEEWAEPYDRAMFEPIEVASGSVVVLNGLLPHWSPANRSARSRHAFVLNLVDGRSIWAADNWLARPPTMPFRGFDGSPI